MNPRTISLDPIKPLDKWDVSFIRLFKSQKGTQDILNRAVQLWAERCAVDENDFHMPHIAEYLADLIDRLNLTPKLSYIIREMSPSRDWYWGVPNGAGESARAVCVMAAWLRHTEVKYLPGYQEAVERDIELTMMQENADRSRL